MILVCDRSRRRTVGFARGGELQPAVRSADAVSGLSKSPMHRRRRAQHKTIEGVQMDVQEEHPLPISNWPVAMNYMAHAHFRWPSSFEFFFADQCR